MIYIFIFSVVIYIVIILILNVIYPELRWDWSKIKKKDISFPESFIWGTATAAHQVEGNCNNNWSEFENIKNSDGTFNISNGQKSGIACDHWNRYPDDIKLIKRLGVRYYRFSVEWSKIQPTQNSFDKSVLNHYSKLIDMLIENDITPVITLHHFTHPIWFDKLGAFENEDNINYFVAFCEIVFKEFSDKVEYWCTINEPAVVATQGYFSGMFPPGLKKPQLCAIVLKNLLKAHVMTYHKLKKLKNGINVKIGIVKNINQFEPWRRWNILDWLISYAVNHFFNFSSINFIKTGTYKIKIPGLAWISYKDINAKNSIDFFGLNYYSHNHLKFNFSIKEPFTLEYIDSDIMTDMPYTIYGEGIYRAIKYVSTLNVPIIITENGVADCVDNIRSEYINRYLYAVSHAINNGYNVIGYFYWSLMDNFEWAFGYDMKFGLFSVDFDTQNRKLREGAKEFIKIVNNKRIT